MNKALALGIAAAIGLAGQPATAGDNAGMKYFVFPRLEAVWVDRDRDLDDGFQLGMGFGVGVNERWNFEFNLYRGWHDGPPASGDADFTAFTVNGAADFLSRGQGLALLPARRRPAVQGLRRPGPQRGRDRRGGPRPADRHLREG
jgi:hypothetical protein